MSCLCKFNFFLSEEKKLGLSALGLIIGSKSFLLLFWLPNGEVTCIGIKSFLSWLLLNGVLFWTFNGSGSFFLSIIEFWFWMVGRSSLGVYSVWRTFGDKDFVIIGKFRFLGWGFIDFEGFKAFERTEVLLTEVLFDLRTTIFLS